MKIALFLDIIGRDEIFCVHGFQVSGFRFQVGYRVFTTDTLYETSYKTPAGRNSKQIERRTSNIERRILLTLRFTDFKTREPPSAPSSALSNTEPHPTTNPTVVNSGSNDSLRQAQGLSLSKAAESNFEG